jgi:hypothetical protein
MSKSNITYLCIYAFTYITYKYNYVIPMNLLIIIVYIYIAFKKIFIFFENFFFFYKLKYLRTHFEVSPRAQYSVTTALSVGIQR